MRRSRRTWPSPMRTVFSNLGLFSGLLIRLMPKLNAAAGEMLGTGGTFKNVSTEDDGTCRAQAFLRCINDADFEKDLDTLRKMAAHHGVQIVLRDEDNEILQAHVPRQPRLSVREGNGAGGLSLCCRRPVHPAGRHGRETLHRPLRRRDPLRAHRHRRPAVRIVHGENENISIDKLPHRGRFLQNSCCETTHSAQRAAVSRKYMTPIKRASAVPVWHCGCFFSRFGARARAVRLRTGAQLLKDGRVVGAEVLFSGRET